jgi:hypothetical protein
MLRRDFITLIGGTVASTRGVRPAVAGSVAVASFKGDLKSIVQKGAAYER